jgi:Ala-tRNA(Pro) deacylase
MIPTYITDYLEKRGVPCEVLAHTQAVTAQEVAAATHVSGHAVAKSVLVEAGGRRWIALLPASENVDLVRLAEALGVREVRLMDEHEFAPIFKGCDAGAEPPFGSLYGLPVIVDRRLTGQEDIVIRAGTHHDGILLSYRAFAALERPRVASFGIPQTWATPEPRREVRI